MQAYIHAPGNLGTYMYIQTLGLCLPEALTLTLPLTLLYSGQTVPFN